MLKQPINKKLQLNQDYIKQVLQPEKNFDIILRNFCIGSKEALLLGVDGLTNGDLLGEVMKVLFTADREDISVDAVKKVFNHKMIAFQTVIIDDLNKGINEMLAGKQLLLINGETKAILLETKSWLTRGPDEPELEKATRGAGDGFVETILFNVAAIRRRLRDPMMRAEPFRIGDRAKNDVALIYIEDIANPELVEEIRSRLEKIVVDGIPLGDKNIEEFLLGKSINPLPKLRYTERPDNVAAHLLEGHVVILVDNSPTALVLPAPFLVHVQSLEEYRQSPLVGTYLTMLRLVAVPMAMLLAPVWLLLSIQPELLPEGFRFIGPRTVGQINLGLQFILASLGIDLIRMASIHTPNTLATSLGLIGALMLGEFSVKAGLFSSEVIFYMAISAIATFTIPGYELAFVIKLSRFLLLLLVIFFKLWGLLFGLVLVSIFFLLTKTFGIPYLWPIIPLDLAALKTLISRQSVLSLPRKLPGILKTQDPDRRPPDNG